MLLLLSEWLAKNVFRAFNVFSYITLRSAVALITSLIIGLILGPWLIRKLTALKYGQSVRTDGPATHLVKQGTPTMGGVLILLSIAISTLLWADLSNHFVWLTLLVTLAYGLVGWVDDWRKIVHKNPKGLSAKEKLFWQTIIAMVAGVFLVKFTGVSEHSYLVVPVFKELYIPLPFVGFMLMFFFVVVGSSNGVNLTDGLDGLAIMPCILVAAGMAIFAYVVGNVKFSNYLSYPYIAGTGELMVFLAALMGAGLAFLWFNAYPAQVFMGDVGALAIGAALGTVAMIIRQEIVLLIMGGVFVVESVSVMMQVSYFKYTRKRYGQGRRIFHMAPLHHHYEHKGWKETQVVVRFWIITIILVMVGLSLLKVR